MSTMLERQPARRYVTAHACGAVLHVADAADGLPREAVLLLERHSYFCDELEHHEPFCRGRGREAER